MPSSPPSSVLLPSTNVKTSFAATAPFRGSQQYLWERFLHCGAEFAEPDEKETQWEKFVTLLKTRLEERKTQLEEIRKNCDRVRISYLNVVKERDSAQHEALALRPRVTGLENLRSSLHLFL